MTLTFEIGELPKTPNSMGKSSIWYTQAERVKWRKIIGLHALKIKKPGPFAKACLTLTRCSSREPDIDNLYSSFKFVIDALKFNGLILDDKPSNIDLKCLWQKAKQKEGKIIIKIEKVEEVAA